jgi:hypothetical protein
MFQALAPLHHPNLQRPSAVASPALTFSLPKCPSFAVLFLNPNEKATSWPIITIAFDR